MNAGLGLLIGAVGVGLCFQFTYAIAEALSLMPQFWLYLLGIVLMGSGKLLIKD